MLELGDFPPRTRVRLDERGEKRLWEKVESHGGVRSFCSGRSFTESKVYNWKNHQKFYPLGFVLELLNEPSGRVEAYRGGNGLAVENPDLPVPGNAELLTRIRESVSVNHDGVPVYRSQEPSLTDHFHELLQELGNVPVSVYSRDSGYELRYPKIVHRVLVEMGFEPEFAALVDESGSIQDGSLVAGGRKVPVADFDGELHSRDMRLELALERNNSSEVRDIMSEEVEKVRQAFRS